MRGQNPILENEVKSRETRLQVARNANPWLQRKSSYPSEYI
jgi:hypothetical protein